LFEITLEPYGGSTTGRPTGPILFIGRAVKT
jgi:anti-sigma-K factor RskA